MQIIDNKCGHAPKGAPRSVGRSLRSHSARQPFNHSHSLTHSHSPSEPNERADTCFVCIFPRTFRHIGLSIIVHPTKAYESFTHPHTHTHSNVHSHTSSLTHDSRTRSINQPIKCIPGLAAEQFAASSPQAIV